MRSDGEDVTPTETGNWSEDGSEEDGGSICLNDGVLLWRKVRCEVRTRTSRCRGSCTAASVVSHTDTFLDSRRSSREHTRCEC